MTNMIFFRSAIFPFFLLKTEGRFINLNDWEEVAFLAHIHSNWKNDFCLTKIYYPFLFVKFENNRFLSFDGYKFPEMVKIPNIPISTESLLSIDALPDLIQELQKINTEISLLATSSINTEIISPLPVKVLQSLNAYRHYWLRYLIHLPTEKLNLLSPWWQKADYEHFINNLNFLKQNFEEMSIKSSLKQINQFLKFLSTSIPNWVQLTIDKGEKTNKINEILTSNKQITQVMKQTLDEVIAYYEGLITTLRNEISGLKSTINQNEQDALALLSNLDLNEQIVEKNENPKQNLLDLIQSIRDKLNFTKVFLSDLLDFSQYSYIIPAFEGTSKLVSIPIYILVPKNGNFNLKNCNLLYPSLLPRKKYLGEPYKEISFISPIGSYIKETLSKQPISTGFIRSCSQNLNFFQFKHKAMIDTGMDSLRKKKLI